MLTIGLYTSVRPKDLYLFKRSQFKCIYDTSKKKIESIEITKDDALKRLNSEIEKTFFFIITKDMAGYDNLIEYFSLLAVYKNYLAEKYKFKSSKLFEDLWLTINEKKNTFIECRIGKNTLYDLPKTIAKRFLFLTEAEASLYTGKALRSSTATILANRTNNPLDIQTQLGHNNQSMALAYIQSSRTSAIRRSSIIASAISPNNGRNNEINNDNKDEDTPRRDNNGKGTTSIRSEYTPCVYHENGCYAGYRINTLDGLNQMQEHCTNCRYK